MNMFFDTEFTGLHKNTTLISIGLVTAEKQMFYAELTDYDPSQVDEWIEKHVISRLYLTSTEGSDLPTMRESPGLWTIKGTSQQVGIYLRRWLAQFNEVIMWGDCLAWDWILFCDLFGDAFHVPSNVYYIPFDIATLFKARGLDADISREEYGLQSDASRKHNALSDALVIKSCYERLTEF